MQAERAPVFGIAIAMLVLLVECFVLIAAEPQHGPIRRTACSYEVRMTTFQRDRLAGYRMQKKCMENPIANGCH